MFHSKSDKGFITKGLKKKGPIHFFIFHGNTRWLLNFQTFVTFNIIYKRLLKGQYFNKEFSIVVTFSMN